MNHPHVEVWTDSAGALFTETTAMTINILKVSACATQSCKIRSYGDNESDEIRD